MTVRSIALLLALAGLPAVATAQTASATPTGPTSLFTAGGAFEPYTFGDDSPKGTTGVGITLGFQGRRPFSTSKALVFELAAHPIGVQNPWFDETVRVIHVLAGVEFGRRTYVRPAGGVGLAFWSGESESSIEAGLALAVSVGRRLTLRSRWRLSPEFFWRMSGGPGWVAPAYGAQLAIGRAR